MTCHDGVMSSSDGRKPYLQVTTDSQRLDILRNMKGTYAASQSAVTNLALDVLNELTAAQVAGAKIVLHYTDGEKRGYKLPVQREGLTTRTELLEEVERAQKAFSKVRSK